MTEQAEALLAVTGLSQVLEGRAPAKAQLARSTQLDEELLAAVAGYLAGKRSAPAPGELPAELPPALPPDAHGAIGGLDPEVATGYALAAARALTYLNGLAPRRKLPGLRPRLADRAAAEQAELRRAAAVVQDPIGVLGDLDAVTQDQLEALRAVYPTLWSALGLQATEAMAAANRDLTQREERTIGRLLGVAAADVQDLQALHQPPESGPQGGGEGGEGRPTLASPVQQLQGRDAAG